MVIVLRILSFNTCMYLPDTWLLLQGARGNCLLKKPYCQQVLTRPRLLLQMKGHGCQHPQHCHSAPSHKWIFEFASHHCRLHVGPQSNKFAIYWTTGCWLSELCWFILERNVKFLCCQWPGVHKAERHYKDSIYEDTSKSRWLCSKTVTSQQKYMKSLSKA